MRFRLNTTIVVSIIGWLAMGVLLYHVATDKPKTAPNASRNTITLSAPVAQPVNFAAMTKIGFGVASDRFGAADSGQCQVYGNDWMLFEISLLDEHGNFLKQYFHACANTKEGENPVKPGLLTELFVQDSKYVAKWHPWFAFPQEKGKK